MDEAELLRRIYPGVLARLVRHTRALAEAEDALQDAVLKALERWPEDGVPDEPAAWLLTAAKNRATDNHRRRATATRHAPELLARARPWTFLDVERWDDELLGLLFTCCDPVLEREERTALTLATVAGMSSREIARAFLLTPATVDQRLSRARKRLQQRRGAYEPVDVRHAPERLAEVLAVVYLIFNEGYWSEDAEPIRDDLCRLAASLAQGLRTLFPAQAEVLALLGLLWLHEGRRPARLDGAGAPVPLDEQDRSRWDRACLEEGADLVRRALQAGPPGPLAIEAAIAAVHGEARRAEDTDWVQIALLYRALEEARPSPVVRVNRAFALGQAGDPQAGLALLDEVDPERVPYAFAVAASLWAALGDEGQTRDAVRQALARTTRDTERNALRKRFARFLDEPTA